MPYGFHRSFADSLVPAMMDYSPQRVTYAGPDPLALQKLRELQEDAIRLQSLHVQLSDTWEGALLASLLRHLERAMSQKDGTGRRTLPAGI